MREAEEIPSIRDPLDHSSRLYPAFRRRTRGIITVVSTPLGSWDLWSASNHRFIYSGGYGLRFRGEEL